MRGRIVILSGINGAGKEVQSKKLEARWEQERGIVVKRIYGPQITHASRNLQKVILSEGTRIEDPFAEYLAYMSLHIEVARKVEPLLKAGLSIVLDRGPETAYVYNAVANQLEGTEAILARNLFEYVMNILRPDLVIVLNVPLAEARRRASKQAASDHIQDRSDQYFERVQAAYETEAKRYGWQVINASGDVETVHRLVWAFVDQIPTPLEETT